MKTSRKIFSIFALLVVLALALASPAEAFDGRSGDSIIINANEVIHDDLYVSANKMVLEGTIEGDLVFVGSNLTILGTVEGDLIAAGQSVVIEGKVLDDVRIAGAVLKLGSSGVVGGDVLAAGGSFEAAANSQIGGELVVGAGQSLLNGNIAGDVLAGTGSLELNGTFGGDVKAEVGEAEDGGISPNVYMPQSDIQFPTVKPGFNVGQNAKIAGDLEYTQSKDINIPAGVIGGKTTRTQPSVEAKATPEKPSEANKTTNWALDLLRHVVTWMAFGLLLAWLVPLFMKSLMENIEHKPWASLGWGVVTYAAFFFLLFLIVLVMILGGVIFGILTLGSISGTIIWLGILAIFALTLAFILVTLFLTKILVAWLCGKWILRRFHSNLSEHRVWSMLLGVVIVAILTTLPVVGWVFRLLITFVGLGSLWLWGRERWQGRKAGSST